VNKCSNFNADDIASVNRHASTTCEQKVALYRPWHDGTVNKCGYCSVSQSVLRSKIINIVDEIWEQTSEQDIKGMEDVQALYEHEIKEQHIEFKQEHPKRLRRQGHQLFHAPGILAIVQHPTSQPCINLAPDSKQAAARGPSEHAAMTIRHNAASIAKHC